MSDFVKIGAVTGFSIGLGYLLTESFKQANAYVGGDLTMGQFVFEVVPQLLFNPDNAVQVLFHLMSCVFFSVMGAGAAALGEQLVKRL